MPTESTQWRKFLQPVVTGLVALMAAGFAGIGVDNGGKPIAALECNVGM